MNIIYLPKINGKIQQEMKEDRKTKRETFVDSVGTIQRYIDEQCKNRESGDFGEFEKGLWNLLMLVGLRAVQLYLASKRTSLAQRHILGSDGRVYKYVKEKTFQFRSIFGQGTYVASLYRRGEKRNEKREMCLLDSQVGLLPAGGMSPILAMDIVQLCTRMAYEQAKEVLGHFRAYVPSTRSICGIIDLVGTHAEGVLDNAQCKGGEVAVIQADARCAPKIREDEYEKRCKPHKKRVDKRNTKGRIRRIRPDDSKKENKRRTRGKKAKNNKRVTVGIIYALNRCEDGSWEGSYGKFFARFGAAEEVFKRLRKTVDAMDEMVKKVIFISDGDPQYRKLQLKYFPNAIAVIDFYHVSEYLWKAGETLYREGSSELESFVSQLKEMLRNGEAFEVLSILRNEKDQISLRGPGTKGRRQRMSQAINYIAKRVNQMPYKELRDQGLEIGSGAIEGAVRQIVAIRFDGPGMRWGEHRPQLLLHMICIRLSGAWENFTKTIVMWAHQRNYRRRMTPIGVNEHTAKKPQPNVDDGNIEDNTEQQRQIIDKAA